MTSLREATPDDAPSLARLLARSPQAGRMVVSQDRTPDPFARRRPFSEAVTLVDEHVSVTGTAALKEVLVSGEVVRAAYVFDVAVDEHSRGRGFGRSVLGALEGWARDRDAAFAYAHVLGGNAASTGLFAAAGYEVRRRLGVRLYPVLARPGAEPPVLADWDAAAAVLRQGLRAYDLVRPLDGVGLERLWTSLPGWRSDDVWQTPQGVLGVWDHRPVARSVPLRVPVEMRLIRTIGRAARRLGLRFPATPRTGRPIAYGVLVGGVGIDRELEPLLRAAVGRAAVRGLEVLVFCHDADVRPPWTKAAFSVAERYLLVAKALGDPVTVGSRPVWVDATDL